jgi:hypothetical protein
MRRIDLFEFNDQPWLPEVLRESITESLGWGIRSSRVFEAVAPVFAEFLKSSGGAEVLDLCSGSGEPMDVLLDAMRSVGGPLPRVTLSDLFPNQASLERVARRRPDAFHVASGPIDATRVPRQQRQPVRTIINTLHHFSPEVVRSILRDCVRSSVSIFVIESFPRSLPRAMRLTPALIRAALLNPLRASRRRIAKAALTPAVFAIGAFDLLASVMRIHTVEELSALAQSIDAPGYRWGGGQAGGVQWFEGISPGGSPAPC